MVPGACLSCRPTSRGGESESANTLDATTSIGFWVWTQMETRVVAQTINQQACKLVEVNGNGSQARREPMPQT